MVMKALRDGAKGGVLKFFLLGILCLAAGGLIFTDVGGFFRGGGFGSNDVAKVGNDKISLPQFDNMVRRTLAPLGISPAQAHQLGYLREVLNAELRRRILLQSARDDGIVIDERHIVEQVSSILAPSIQSGQSPQDALANLLRQQGMSEAMLRATIASEKSLGLLNGALQAGAVDASSSLAEDLYLYQSETRDIRYIPFLDEAYEGVAEPDEAQLRDLFERTKNAYAIPETRDLQIVNIKLETIKAGISISDEALRMAYEENIEDYTLPETRTIEQVIVPTQEEAEYIIDVFKKGQSFKDSVAPGNYYPPKNFTKDNIIDELKEIVFAQKKTGLIWGAENTPTKTPLGWAVVRITNIQPAGIQSFETTKDQIRADILDEQLGEELFSLLDEIDDAFASGAMPDDVVGQFNLETQTLDTINTFGLDLANKKLLEDPLLSIAFDLEDGETSSAVELSNGDFGAIHVKSITPKSYPPFEDVKEQITERWIRDNRALSNREFVQGVLQENTEQGLTELAKSLGKKIKKENAIKRGGAFDAAFAADLEGLFIMNMDGGLAIGEVTKAHLPEEINEDAVADLKATLRQEQKNELFQAYIGAQSEVYNVSINQGLIDQYYTQQSEN